jgi:two-component system sensor histidine kinase PilS (NtrC family)
LSGIGAVNCVSSVIIGTLTEEAIRAGYFMSTVIASESLSQATAWKALRFFNFYRIIISGIFVVLLLFNNLPRPLGAYDPELFAVVSVAYLLCAIFVQVAVEYRIYRYDAQVLSQLALDVVAITMMMHASGGVDSGFGMLLVVAVAGASILTAGRTVMLYAALAALAVLVEELYSLVIYALPAANYTQAGLLGATFFATALLGHVLSRRLRETEALAQQRGLDVRNLARLNEIIVQRMRSGIMVLDDRGYVRLANEAASGFFGQVDVQGINVHRDLPELGDQLSAWLDDAKVPSRVIRPKDGEVDVMVSFARLEPASSAATLVFMEDASVMHQRVQQLKLASLGRLAASIAHEIRNPVGAISHAGQLLAESDSLDEEDARLTAIIRDHCSRVNDIVEGVMRISRRGSSIPESIQLGPWLRRFREEFAERLSLQEDDVVINDIFDAVVQFDVTQLHQIVWNLCENAVRYSKGCPLLKLEIGTQSGSDRPFLDIIDHGPGMEEAVIEHLFEPFFTTESQGSGLGLYIARELCLSNQAGLHLVRSGASGSCFRIVFAHPDKRLLTV